MDAKLTAGHKGIRLFFSKNRMKANWRYFLVNKELYFLLIPCIVYFILFKYVPMYGITLAFKNFSFAKGVFGSPWAGLENFAYMFGLSDFYRVVGNSLILSLLRLVFYFPIPILLALMLNEIPLLRYKKFTQSILYLPYFISWVVIGGILINLLSPSWGIINGVIKALGGDPIFFLGKDKYFRAIIVVSQVWKDAGWDTIIYLAAITVINPELYEAAAIDGASKLRRIWHITLPGIKSTIMILLLLAIGRLMSNGFEQIYVFQNGSNIMVSEVLETYTYKLGMVNGRFSFASSVGLFSSTVGFVLLVIANWAAKMMGEEGIF